MDIDTIKYIIQKHISMYEKAMSKTDKEETRKKCKYCKLGLEILQKDIDLYAIKEMRNLYEK